MENYLENSYAITYYKVIGDFYECFCPTNSQIQI